MLQQIRELDPPKLSMRISESGQALVSISQVRKTEPAQLSRFVQGDLDWIVMKTLEKDRSRRYETANGLAEDVRRFLADEPVLAGPPSIAYRFRKFARRNKALLTTASVVALVMIMATFISSTLAIWAVSAERRASNREQQAQVAATSEKEQRKLAEAATNKAEEIATFFTAMLEGVGPSVALGHDTKLLREILDKTSARIDRELKDQPEVEAEIRTTMGHVYRDLGEFSNAEAMYREVLKLRQEIFAEANPLFIESLCDLGEILNKQLRFHEAEGILERAKKLGTKVADQNFDASFVLRNLGVAYIGLGKQVPAEEALRKALSIQRKALSGSNDDLQVAMTLHYLASALANQDKFSEAESIARQVLKIRTQNSSPDHPEIAKAHGLLAFMCRCQGRYQDAEEAYRQELVVLRKVLGNRHPNTILSLSNLGSLLLDCKRNDEAEKLIKEAYELSLEIDESAFELVPVDFVYARLLDEQGNTEQAEQIAQTALTNLRTKVGDKSPILIGRLVDVGRMFYFHDKFGEAEVFAREANDLAKALTSNRRLRSH